MKNKFLQFLFILISISGFSQSGQEIIDRHIEKSGGVKAWKLLNSIQLNGKVTLSLTETFPIEIQQARPKYSKTSIWINDKKRTIEGFDGKYGYQMNYQLNELLKNADYKSERFESDLIDYKSKGFTINYLGKEKVNGKEAYKIALQKNVNTTIYFFDAETYMLIKEINNGETMRYSDYKKVGNLYFPFRIEGENPAEKSEYVMQFDTIKINKAFPKNNFKFD